MVPDLQKKTPVQAQRSTEALPHQPAGAFPMASKSEAGEGKRSLVCTFDGASQGNSSGHGVADNVRHAGPGGHRKGWIYCIGPAGRISFKEYRETNQDYLQR